MLREVGGVALADLRPGPGLAGLPVGGGCHPAGRFRRPRRAAEHEQERGEEAERHATEHGRANISFAGATAIEMTTRRFHSTREAPFAWFSREAPARPRMDGRNRAAYTPRTTFRGRVDG